jgi:predicted  nucleic acid-binding Zn-ribbon protein
MTEQVTPQQQQIDDQKVNIDGTEYRFGDLPAQVKDMVVVMSRWNMELMDKRLEVAKLEHAVKSITNDISKTMKKKDAAPTLEIKGDE